MKVKQETEVGKDRLLSGKSASSDVWLLKVDLSNTMFQSRNIYGENSVLTLEI